MNLKKILDSVKLTELQSKFLEDYKKGVTEYFPKSEEFGEFSGRYVSEEMAYNSRNLKRQFPALYDELKKLKPTPSKEEKDELRFLAQDCKDFHSFKIKTSPQGSAFIEAVLQNSQTNPNWGRGKFYDDYPKIVGWFYKENDGSFTGYDPDTSNDINEPTLSKAIASYKRLIKQTHEGRFNWK